MSIRAGETIMIPSPIDVHAHLREPGGEDKETIKSGTFAALNGGYQAVFDMPNNPGGNETWTQEKLEQKTAIAATDAYTNIGFYAGVNLVEPDFDEFPQLVRSAAGLKLYMGVTTGNTAVRDLDSVRPAIDAWIDEAHTSGQTPPILLHARDEIGEETARYVAGREYPVHWCHLSSLEEVEATTRLTREFPEFYTGGVTPHHLTMTSRNADFQQGWNSARMQPPLGDEIDADALLNAYNNRYIQILETDHAPHTADDKLKAEIENPSGHTDEDCTTCYGISGIEFVLPVMMSLVQRNKITLERLVDSLYDQPLKMLQMKASKTAAQTTLFVHPYVIEKEDIASKSSNTPYIGWTGWGQIMEVTIDGVYRLGDSSVRDRRPRPRILKAGEEA